MIFKNLETDQEWLDAVCLRNLFNWSYPVSVDESKAMFERHRQERHDFRLVGLEGGTVVVFTAVSENKNSDDGSFWFNVYIDPNSENSIQLFEMGVLDCLERVASVGGKRAMIEGRGEYPFIREALQRLGFAKGITLPYSRLETATIEAESHPNVISIQQFLNANPDDGMYRLWRCEMEIAADLPLPYPFIETPLEEFSKSILSPEVDLTCKFLFVEDGEVKGLSQLWPSKVDPKLAANGLTGVRRAFRRQGVATKLKKHGIAWAKNHDIEQIFTDNEENNPMFQLNLQLGFRRIFDYEVYSKAC